MAALLDENGLPLLDEGGFPLYDEGGPGPVTPDTPDPNLPPPPPRLAVGVGPSSGNGPTQPLTSFAGMTIKDSLTAGPQIVFSMPGNSPAARVTDGLATDVWVYRRSTVAGMPAPGWMRLRTLPIDQQWGDSGEDEAAVTAVGYERVVGARHIITGPPLFTGVDQGVIIWNLIQHTQAQNGGDLGITAGTILTGQPRDRTEYKIGDELGGLFNALGDVINGVWWGVDFNKVLNVKLWAAFPAHPEPLVLGQNARTMRRQRGKAFGNVAGAVGSANVTEPRWAEDPGIASDPRGRWEVFDASHSSVIDQTLVADYASGNLADALNPPSQWTVSLEPAAYFEGSSNYAVGDFVRVGVPTSAVDEIGAPSVLVRAQVTEVSISFDDSGAVGVSVTAREVL